jgi:alcohol dehydrogenase class IV
MLYNLDYAQQKYASVARLLGIDVAGLDTGAAAELGVERVRELFGAIDIPMHLRRFGVHKDDLAQIASESMPSGSLKHNPRSLTPEDVQAILRDAL